MTTEKNKSRAWLCWLIGGAMAAALMALGWFFCDIRYTTNDDAAILRPFMGFECAEIPNFHFIVHTIIAYPLRWLALAFPGQAWFSWMQLAFLWLSCTVIVKSILQCFQKRGLALGWGLLCAVVYCASFAMMYLWRITFTITAAMLGAAAVLQVLSIDGRRYTNGQVLRSLLLALLLVALAYGLRQITAVPILAFCALAFVYLAMRDFGLGKRAKRSLKPLVCFLIVGAVIFGGLVVGREAEIRAKGMEDYLRWQRARSNVMDYGGTENLPDELLAELGWTRAEVTLIDDWNLLDANITTEAFEKVAAYHSAADQRGFGERLADSAALTLSTQQREPIAWRSVYVLLGMIALYAAALLLHGRKNTLWQWLCLGAGVLLSALMLLYLGFQGRLPLRAVLLATLPLAALVFGLLPDCLPDMSAARGGAKAARAATLAALGLCVAALCALYAAPAVCSALKPAQNEYDEAQTLNPYADLDELAAENPDNLYIYDITIATDSRLFPSAQNGTPENVMFWGGWGARSPENLQQLAAFDIDPATMDPTLFLREDVYLARGVIDTEPDTLTARIAELAGKEIYYQSVEEWGGVHIGQFYQ